MFVVKNQILSFFCLPWKDKKVGFWRNWTNFPILVCNSKLHQLRRGKVFDGELPCHPHQLQLSSWVKNPLLKLKDRLWCGGSWGEMGVIEG